MEIAIPGLGGFRVFNRVSSIRVIMDFLSWKSKVQG